jgi:hypothetical protein
MKRISQLAMAAIILTLFAFGCQPNEEKIKNDLNQEKQYVNADNTLNSEAIVQSLVTYLSNEAVKNVFLAQLEAKNHGDALEAIVSEIPSEFDVNGEIHKIIKASIEQNATAETHGIVEIPEVWLYRPVGKYNYSDVLIACPPKGNEEEWKTINAYDLNGNVVELDAHKVPEQPVIVLETNGQNALKLRVKLMNKMLKKLGVQKARATLLKNDLETTKLNKIRLNDDKEPWIKGAAEIYAVTSGIREGSNNREPEITIIAMPYLDYKDKDYYPNQVMLFWDNYTYQAANIQLFEQDSNYNYKELVQILTNGVFQIAGLYTAEPWLPILGEIASKIIEVMPDEWYTDSDDYVDSYYTIMKNQSYTNYMGAAGNAKVTLVPLTIPEN